MTFSHGVSALGKILLYLALVILAGCLLSPPIYWIGHEHLAHPFYRYFSRVTQIAALVLIVPLLLWLKVRSVREFGIERNPHKVRDVVSGVLLALIPLALLGAGYFYFGIYKMKDEFLLKVLFRIIGTAAVVAVLEEFLFRGVLLGLAAKAMGRWLAAIVISAIFAGVHFLKPAKIVDPSVEWWTGFAQLTRVAGSAPEWPMLVLGFAALFVVGLILTMAAFRTRSLFLPIGLHAGWVLGQQGMQWLGKYRVKPEDALLPWIGPNVVSGAVPVGLAPIGVLLVTGVAVWFYLRHARTA
jgi:uncharacterized protein